MTTAKSPSFFTRAHQHMIHLTEYARQTIDRTLPVSQRKLYLRWREGCTLAEPHQRDVLSTLCNLLRRDTDAPIRFRTIREYESWLLRNGFARRHPVLTVPRCARSPVNRMWSPEKLQQLTHLLQEGVATDDIADRLHVTKGQVRNALYHHPEVKPV
jgi:hypothetical protein